MSPLKVLSFFCFKVGRGCSKIDYFTDFVCVCKNESLKHVETVLLPYDYLELIGLFESALVEIVCEAYAIVLASGELQNSGSVFL